MGADPGSSRCALWCHRKGPCKREAERDFTDMQRRDCEDGGGTERDLNILTLEIAGTWPTSQGMPSATRS